MKLVDLGFVTVAFGVMACGGGANDHGADAAPADGARDGATSATLTLTTYRSTGPINTQFVAVQDGNGPWTVLTGTAGVYTATIRSGYYGIATGCTPTTAPGAGPSFAYGAISDGTHLYVADCNDPGPGTANITGTVSGAAAGDPVRILDDRFFDSSDVAAGTTTYMLASSAGPTRLIAEELVNDRPIRFATVESNLENGAMVPIDLSAGFAPVVTSVTANAAIGAMSASYRDASGVADTDKAISPFDSIRTFPAAQLNGGLNRLLVSNTDGTLQVIRYFAAPVAQAVTFPVALHLAQTPTVTASPYPDVSFVVPVRADASLYDIGFSTTDPATSTTISWSTEMTSAWVASAFPGATAFSYTAPDLHALAGWQTAFQVASGLPVDWSVSASKSTDIDWFETAPPATLFDHDGGELQIANAGGTLPAP